MAITGEDISSIVTSIENIKNSLISLHPKDAIKELHLSSIGSSAKASLDMAFVSILSSVNYDKNIELQTDITISFGDADTMLKDAKDALKHGMDILKIKLAQDIVHAIKVTKMLSKLDAKLIIDANQAWSLNDTLKFIDATKGIDIELIEQPVIASDLNSLKIITNYSKVPILADEAIFTLEDAKKIITSSSADMINIKLMKCGGITKAKEILEYAKENNIKCMLGSMLEGPISINSALHLAFEYNDVIKYIDLDSPLLYKEKSNELEFKYNGSKIIRS